MQLLKDLPIKIFADGANIESIFTLLAQPYIQGFTTNPTLMHQAGITDYEAFALHLLKKIKSHPISFEVFSDDFKEMKRQALKIAAWQKNVFVKIPITNSRGESSLDLMYDLAKMGVRQNVTAVMTLDQVKHAAQALANGPAAIISVYAGRIADTGRDPSPMMATATQSLQSTPHLELMWASSRQVLDIFTANQTGCHIITLTHDLLKKLSNIGKDLSQFSLETVNMLHTAARAAGYAL